MKRLLLLVLLLCISFMSLSAQSLEETLDWLKSKIEDPIYQTCLSYEFNFDISTGEVIVIQKSLLSESSPKTTSFYLADMDTESFEIRVEANGQYKYWWMGTLNGYRVVKYESDSKVYPQLGEGFFLNNEVMMGRIGEAFKHAIEIAPPSPNAQEGELF